MVIILPLRRGCFHLENTRIPTMDLKKLFTEERAVSPVIGVILMVAITVILAAVIGAFVLGIGGETQETPQVSLSFDQDANGLDIEHRGGASVDADELEVRGNGYTGDSDWNSATDPSPDPFSAGDVARIADGDLAPGERLNVIWTGGSDNAVLGSYEVE